jgi:anti-anti-sigma factor
VTIGEAPVVVSLDGELDMATAAETCDRLATAARLGAHLVIELRNVSFIDSTGMGVLAHAVRNGADIEVRGAPAQVQRAIELSGLIDPVEL